MDSSSSNTVANNNNVWLFNPNLIGYGRIVLAIMAMYYMSSSPCCAMICYALSAGLDALDGWAARKYNQSSRFGAMLVSSPIVARPSPSLWLSASFFRITCSSFSSRE